MSFKLPKLDFSKLTCMILLVFIKIKFTHLPFAREFEIRITLYPRKHRETLICDQTFYPQNRKKRQLVIRCVIHRQAPGAQWACSSALWLSLGQLFPAWLYGGQNGGVEGAGTSPSSAPHFNLWL